MDLTVPRPGIPLQSPGGYTKLPDAVLLLDLTPREFQTLAHLLSFRRAGGPIFPRVRVLAERMRCSERTVQRAIRGLEGAGMLVVVPQFRRDDSQTSNLYAPGPILAPLLSAVDDLTVSRPSDDRRPPVTSWSRQKKQTPRKQAEGSRAAYPPADHPFFGRSAVFGPG